jgi:radical SAM superfamily enzyme YgiQ (UPF0313 family)
MIGPAVLLVNPNRMRPPVAPLGLEYVAEGLSRGGYDPVPCDLTFVEDWRAALDAAVSTVRPAAIAVSIRNLDDAYFASQDYILEKTAAIVAYLRAISGAPIVAGGVGFSIAPREILDYLGVPYGIAGEGEAALSRLLDVVRAGQEPYDVPGVLFRSESGGVVFTPPAQINLETFPIPSRRYFEHPRYFAEGGQAGVETKRGCSHRCVYCVEPHAKGAVVRLRRPESVAVEMQDLLDQGIDVFHLCDSEFNIPASHAHAVCEAIERAGIAGRIRWYAYCYAEPFDGPLAHAMARAGCAGVNFGIDHGDEGMLRRLGRGYGPIAIRLAAEACRGAGIALMFDLLLGSPGETRETLARAIELMREVSPDRVGLSCGVRVYPHTPLAAQLRGHGAIETNPNLHGAVRDNPHFLRPIFYVESGLGGDIHTLISGLVRGEERFLHADPAQVDGNYNYNDNSVLANAIRAGERGAYWDILRRISIRGAQ